MLRVLRLLRCVACPPAHNAISEAYSQIQGVWNMDFGNLPATTTSLNFHEVPDPSVQLFHLTTLDGCIADSASSAQAAESDDVFAFKVGEEENTITRPVAERMMRTMIAQNTLDKIMLEAQRQGRVSFYMTMFGEEAAVVGAAAGLSDKDEVFMQYREAGILNYRGYTIPEFIAQCMGNCECDMKGRQMPIHYGSRRLNVQMVSSPLGTQIPHGAGAGYAFRLENDLLRQKPSSGGTGSEEVEPRICVTFFGEGAASEGDFHAGLNFASTVGAHTLFFVRNNGYAISTSTHEQYTGDGILGRAVGYGIPTARVDGHDVLAVFHTVRKARKLILTANKPVLVEAITYRLSHHSTSDDSAAYRPREEIEYFASMFSPIERFEKFMTGLGWWSAEHSAAVADKVRKETLSELKRQEKLPPWPIATMCDDVYKEMTPHLKAERDQLLAHYSAYKSHYDKERL